MNIIIIMSSKIFKNILSICVFYLHKVGIFESFYIRHILFFPTHVEKSYEFLLGKFFQIFKNGQKKCPKFENPKYFAQKAGLCDHNLILWCGYQKNNFKNVTIIFFYKYLKILSCVNVWKL